MLKRKAILYLMLATVLTRLLWLFMVPMVEAPDENTHLWVIRFMAEHLRLPLPGEISEAGRLSVYGAIPQFGYIPHILSLYCLSGILHVSMAARVASVFLAAFLTLAACLLA